MRDKRAVLNLHYCWTTCVCVRVCVSKCLCEGGSLYYASLLKNNQHKVLIGIYERHWETQGLTSLKFK